MKEHVTRERVSALEVGTVAKRAARRRSRRRRRQNRPTICFYRTATMTKGFPKRGTKGERPNAKTVLSDGDCLFQ